MNLILSFRILLISILLCLVFLFLGEISGAVKKKHTLKILTYNIHHAAPPSKEGAIDLDAVAGVINDAQPDLVALQEVDVNTGRSGPYNQAEELGRMTGLTPYFFKSIDFDGGEYGVAILSRYPVIDAQRFPLPRKEGVGGEPRILATVTLELGPKEKIIFACTHLDAQRDSVNRRLQMNAIVALLEDTALPIVIAGDFNAEPASQAVDILDAHFTRTCDPCGLTFPADHPKKVIDFIAHSPSRNIAVKEHMVLTAPTASDHLPVMAVLEIKF